MKVPASLEVRLLEAWERWKRGRDRGEQRDTRTLDSLLDELLTAVEEPETAEEEISAGSPLKPQYRQKGNPLKPQYGGHGVP